MPQPLYQPVNFSAALDGFRVEYTEEGLRADIVLDRPPFNLLSNTQLAQMSSVFEALDADPGVRVIVVRGSGEHFSRGGMFEELINQSSDNLPQVYRKLRSPMRCSKPVIAQTRGYCFGAALELALACDFRIATETTLYALTTPKKGQIPDIRSAPRLSKFVGIGRMKDLIMRSRRVSGVQALDWGIATEFAVDSGIEGVTDALIKELLAFSPLAQRTVKKLLNAIEDMPLFPDTEPEPVADQLPPSFPVRALRSEERGEKRLRTGSA